MPQVPSKGVLELMTVRSLYIIIKSRAIHGSKHLRVRSGFLEGAKVFFKPKFQLKAPWGGGGLPKTDTFAYRVLCAPRKSRDVAQM